LSASRPTPFSWKGVVFAAALSFALPVHAGLLSDDEARTQINNVRLQLEDLTRRVDSVTQHQGDFTNQIEAMKSDIAKLRGQIDELNYNLDAAQKRQKDFYVDLDNRLRKIESQAQAEQSAADAAKTAEATAMRDYEAALTALRASDYKAALRGFETFINNAPKSPQQPAANFFAAYCYSHLKLHAKAVEMYRHLAETWPDDEHVPDAMLGRADSLEALGEKNEARAVLIKLAARFPGSDAGKQAKARLKKK
jgi:tol-pal system protein YbgF